MADNTTNTTTTTNIYAYSRGEDGLDTPRDVAISRFIYSSILVLCFTIFIGRIAQLSHSYLRQITALSSTQRQQAYWAQERSVWWPRIKKHFLYAPLGRKRHNREIQLSSAVGIGTLPSRFQTIFISLYLMTQIIYCVSLDYSVSESQAIVSELRGRSGVLAVLNMVPLFVLASRNNPLISILHISFDTYNLIHRWLGRIVVFESIVHTVAWAVNACQETNFSDMMTRMRDTPFFWWGLIGTVSLTFLGLHSPSPIRHAFYETFLHLHQLFAILAYIGVYVHLHLDGLPQVPWMWAIAALWGAERMTRVARLIYLNYSPKHGKTQVTVEALHGEACLVTFHLPKHANIQPGGHVYAYIPCVSWWMSHPFSIAWADSKPVSQSPRGHEMSDPDFTPSDLEKQGYDMDLGSPNSEQRNNPTEVSLIIGAQQGMTRKLYNMALSKPNGVFNATGFIEGPYGCHPALPASYGTAVLFSAGAGITHHLLYTRELVLRAATETAATRKVYLVWAVRSKDHLSWLSKWMNDILKLPMRNDILTIKLFVSKPRSPSEIVSPSSTVQMFPGRCKPDVVLDEVLPNRVGATLVSVCGPGAFADEVRMAARERIGKGAVIDFTEEAFTW